MGCVVKETTADTDTCKRVKTTWTAIQKLYTFYQRLSVASSSRVPANLAVDVVLFIPLPQKLQTLNFAPPTVPQCQKQKECKPQLQVVLKKNKLILSWQDRVFYWLIFRSDSIITSEEWANAPEFVPSSVPSIAATSYSVEEQGVSLGGNVTSAISYAQVVNASSGQTSISASDPLCPYAEASGICKKPNCSYLHGDICELCGCAALHPMNEDSRKKHTNVILSIS